MRLMIFGAGVLGTFYAAKLLACGHEVTVLARGSRAAQTRADGLVAQEYGGNCLRARVNVIETLEPDAVYDFKWLCFVLMLFASPRLRRA